MAEYIEREALIRQIDEGFDKTEPTGEEQIGFLKCRKIARELSAADVAPVVSGKWEFSHTSSDGFAVVKCSNCGHEAFAMAIYVREGYFCPYCGAMVEG